MTRHVKKLHIHCHTIELFLNLSGINRGAIQFLIYNKERTIKLYMTKLPKNSM